jgi:hypothetical protein
VINEELKEFKDTHLGKGLRYLLSEIAEPNDRLRLSDSLREIKQSMPSLVYQNKIIEVGHYVVAAQNLEGIPENCYGVVFRLEPAKIHVLFRISGKRLVPAVVRPFEIMPVYTLVVPESKL